jgi:hypothetical protein
MASPYDAVVPADWLRVTQELVSAHPLSDEEIVEVVLESWNAIFESSIGPKGFKIGTHIIPKPQIMGFLLHELIPLGFAARHPTLWRIERSAEDKDLVYIPDQAQSVEIKTSSHASQIFGNRSYAQKTKGTSKKDKSGYYLAINFGKFVSLGKRPGIRKIRFGWLDHSDWVGQTSSTGQQARLLPATEQSKLITLYPRK